VDLYLHSSIHFHGWCFSDLSKVSTLHIFVTDKILCCFLQGYDAMYYGTICPCLGYDTNLFLFLKMEVVYSWAIFIAIYRNKQFHKS
jgi:hypothetical protein